jgi:disease resistance protein RPM1
MRRLDGKQSKQLFLKNACPGEYSDYLQPDSEAILKKCDGQPLALTTVGHFMRKKSWPTGQDCEDVCNQTRFYDLQSGDDTLDRMHQVLTHEYVSLPSHALKACFLYFAMFPSDHPVRAKRLKRQWIAEGFLQPTILCNDPTAENFEKLMNQNIIQPINVSINTKVKTCKTYGMMHEFITLKSLCQNFITLFDGGELRSNHARRISLHHRSITDEASFNIDLSLVRSLVVFGKAGNDILNFGKYQLLRVLDLEDCTDFQNDHLREVCNLLLLKYLSLGGNVTSLPKEIKQLKLLETLDLRRTNVKILPTEVIQLPYLIHLLGKFQLEDKAMQDELQKFLASGKCKLQTLGGFVVDESEGFAEIMGCMKKLRKVKIWCEPSATSTKLTTLQKAIQEFIHDEKDASNDPRSLSLYLDGCSEDFLKDLKAPCYLRSLKLQGGLLELPGFVMALRRLRELCLQSTKMTADLLTALTNLRHLQYLKLIANELEEIHIKDKALPRLLSLCFVLQRPTFPKVEEGALPYLKSLQLLCKDMNGLSGMQIKGFTRLSEVMLHCRVTDGTKENWVRAAKEHPNRPIVLLKRAIPPKVNHGGDSAAAGGTEDEIVDCSVLLEEQIQETHTQMPHDGPDSSFNNMGQQVVCAALSGSSIANNGRVAS